LAAAVLKRELEILLVEDNAADAKLLTMLLDELHFAGHLHRVVDGVEAMDYLLQRGDYSHTPRPDAIILDLNLPRKNGREVLKEVRSHPDLKYIPVFIVTSASRDDDLMKEDKLGSTYFFTKPKDLGGYENMVRTLATVEFALLR